MRYAATKTYGHDAGLSACFRQWRAESHCRLLHGYALSVKLDFEADVLDSRNWVIDFGGLGPVKSYLRDVFDHKTLVAFDDPQLPFMETLARLGLVELVVVQATGCEAFAKMVAGFVIEWLETNGHAPRVRLAAVEIREHGANSAIYRPTAEEKRNKWGRGHVC